VHGFVVGAPVEFPIPEKPTVKKIREDPTKNRRARDHFLKMYLKLLFIDLLVSHLRMPAQTDYLRFITF
jgi:hypothetical protein